MSLDDKATQGALMLTGNIVIIIRVNKNDVAIILEKKPVGRLTNQCFLSE